MKKRQFWLGLALANAALVAAIAAGAWHWSEWRVSTLRAHDIAAEMAEEPAVRVLELTAAEAAPRDVADLPGMWLTFNERVAPDAITPHLSLMAGKRELKRTVERASPDGKRFLIRFDEAFGAGDVVVRLAAGAPAVSAPDAGVAPSLVQWEVTVKIQAAMNLLRLTSYNPSDGDASIEAVFTRIPDAEKATPFLTVEPPVAFRAEAISSWRYDQGLRLCGPFEAGRVYTLTFTAGLPSKSGDALRKTVVRQVQIPDRRASLLLTDSGRYLSPHGRLTVTARAVNSTRYTARLRRVLANNAVFFGLREEDRLPHHYGWGPDAAVVGLEEEIGKREYRLAGTRNEAETFEINLRDIAPGLGAGIYLLELDNPAGDGEQRVIVVSDLGLSLRVGTRQVAVWAMSTSAGTPADGVEIELWSVKNKKLATARTAADGTALLTWEGDAEPFAVTAALGDDQTYLPLNAAHRVVFQDEGGERPFTGLNHEALLTTDRGIYRPGEPLHAHALVRDRTLHTPAPFPVVLRLRKPDGRVLAERGQTLDKYGAAAHTFTLPDGAPTGVYTVESVLPGEAGKVLGRANVRVEDFAPPQLTVSVSGVAPVATAAVHTATLQADYLFGRPAASLHAEATVFFDAVPYEPKGWQGWVFGDETRSFDTIVKRLAAQKLDADGRYTFEVEPDNSWRPPAALRERVCGDVRDGAGRVVSASTEGLVHLYPHYIGLRVNPSADLEVAQPMTLDVALVRPDGTPVAAETDAFVATITRLRWHPVMQKDDEGRLTYRMACEEIPMITNAPVVVAGGLGRLTTSLAETGQYRVSVRDSVGVLATTLPLTVSASGMRWWAWGGTRPDALDLTWDKACYTTGEVARLLIKSPFAGTALISIEGATVLRQETVDLTNTVQEIALTVDASYLPHVRCAVTVVRAATAEEPWRAHRASGAVGLPLMLSERRLVVACAAPTQTRPGQRLDAVVTVTDAAGRPITGRVVVAAVDEGVLRVTDFVQPDPLDWFFAPRSSGVSGYDLFNQLLPEKEDERANAAAHTAGDTFEDAFAGQLSPVRGRRFKPLALWSGMVDLDANGVANVGFDLPEFAGTLRLMVLAYDHERMGACEARIIVKRPHVLIMGLPRFLAPGDVCRLGAEVFNESGAPAEVRLSVRTDGPVALDTDAVQTENVDADGVMRTQWLLRANAGIGLAQVTVRVEAGEEQFEETTELPVRPASGRVLRTALGSVAAGERKRVDLPGQYAPQTLNWSLSVSGRPEVQLAGALQELLDYPYGCLEQTVSRALPLVYLPELAQTALPGQITREETDLLITSAISHVLAMRQSDGLFSMWGQRGWSSGWDWGTIYTVQFLVEASRAGYPVPADELAVTLDTVAGILNRSTSNNEVGHPEWQAEMALKAHAAAVLTAAGRPPSGWISRLSEQSRLIRRDAAAHVAAACAGAGDTRAAREILERLGVPGHETRNGVNSEARTLALTLLAWCELEPSHPIALEIVRRLNGLRALAGWSTTQENALALLALGRYAQLTADTATSSFTAQVQLADKEWTCSNDEPLLWQGTALTEAGAEIANDGPSACFYVLTADGIPLEPEAGDTAAGLTIKRDVSLEVREEKDRNRLEVGDAVIIKLTLTSDEARDHVVIADLLPAGLEIESATIGNRGSPGFWSGITEKNDVCWSWMRHREVRDDRVVIFSGQLDAGIEMVFYYRARAVTAGTYVWPGVFAQGMYEPEARATSGLRRLVVE